MTTTIRQRDGAETYVRLRGSDAPFTLPGKAYLGSDHLLYVRQGLLSQRLFRFYFKDIEAITCRRTRAGAWLSTALGLVAASLLLVGIRGMFSGVNSIIFEIDLIMVAIMLAAFAVNTVRGPTCVTTVHTRVHSTPLACFSRWRRAQDAIATLREQIDTAQGMLDPEALLSRIEETNGPEALPRVVVGSANAARGLGTEPVRPFRSSGTTGAAMALLVLFSFACGLNASGYSVFNLILGQTILAANMLVLVVALIRQYNTTVPRPVAKATWAAFIVLIIPYTMSATLVQFQVQFQAETGIDLEANTLFNTGFQIFHGLIGLVAFVTGVTGLFLLLSRRQRDEG